MGAFRVCFRRLERIMRSQEYAYSRRFLSKYAEILAWCFRPGWNSSSAASTCDQKHNFFCFSATEGRTQRYMQRWPRCLRHLPRVGRGAWTIPDVTCVCALCGAYVSVASWRKRKHGGCRGSTSDLCRSQCDCGRSVRRVRFLSVSWCQYTNLCKNIFFFSQHKRNIFRYCFFPDCNVKSWTGFSPFFFKRQKCFKIWNFTYSSWIILLIVELSILAVFMFRGLRTCRRHREVPHSSLFRRQSWSVRWHIRRTITKETCAGHWDGIEAEFVVWSLSNSSVIAINAISYSSLGHRNKRAYTTQRYLL